MSRPDHGTTGSYDAWPALLFEALTALEGGFAGSLPFLLCVAGVAEEGPLGQAHELSGADASGPPFKTTSGWTRALANNGAAFAEAVLRTVFGYDPPWGGGGGAAGLQPAFAGLRRWGLEGSQLLGIRAPGGGYVDATLTEEGVSFAVRE